ncbi:MAG: MotA/TolQ/ExbB proton channel family protein [Syntrophobacterales bacterium]|nr:MotA/TolQ/ExbB proton channel family protein [Syntrophobacterales bacterium]
MNGFLCLAFTTINLGSTSEGSFLSILGHTGIVVRVVLLILLLLSLGCWTVIVAKFWSFKKIQRENVEFLARFHQSKNFAQFYQESRRFSVTPLVYIFRAGYGEFIKFMKTVDAELGRQAQAGNLGASAKRGSNPFLGDHLKEIVNRAMETASMVERARMERWTPVLASTGSSAPFIGLFGTVWGIMNSFRHIGLQGSASLAVVAPGIAEALIATAIGLAAAIPAVIAYNYFMQKIHVVETDMKHFANDFLNAVEREWVKRSILDGQTG